MAEPENHALVLLGEMRAELRDDFAKSRRETAARFDSIDERIDALHANGVKALEAFIGHSAMVERTIASVDDQMARREKRVRALEDVRP